MKLEIGQQSYYLPSEIDFDTKMLEVVAKPSIDIGHSQLMVRRFGYSLFRTRKSSE